ncbi:DUF1819 family protein [Desulfonatronovibrio magnus]|uniref:DUF1819 family protein n=1 Tax=Desulfonatronovibrio magnus TaxID=698827 RepID=UPI0018DC1868|nr:DUF1819 family protein [Desulfonatronovibrio magnus]
MSFTTGGLFIFESSMFIDLYSDLPDWDRVRKKVMDQNLLQLRSSASSQKISGQICSRLKTLSSNEIEYFRHTSDLEKGYLLWVGVCRAHQFIREFATEILRERYITFRPDIPHEEFDMFFNAKAEWDDSLDRIKPATRLKLRQVLFRMMREAQLITAQHQILPAIISSELADLLAAQQKQDLYLLHVRPIFLR